jgi:hypothetical protein
MVLVPLPLGQCGENVGYINLLAVKAVLPDGGASLVDLQGVRMECRISVSSLRNRLIRAQLALRELESSGLLASSGNDRLWQRKLELIRAVLAEK